MPAALRKSKLRLIIGGAANQPAKTATSKAHPRCATTAAGRLVLCPVCRGHRKVRDENGKLVKCTNCNGTGLVFGD